MSDWSFARRGFSLFPVIARTKSPAQEWTPYQSAPASPAQLEAWAKFPFNTGVATGAVSKCIVLDCDNALARVMAESRGMPETLRVATPRGTHFYLRHPGWPVSNRAGMTWTIAEGADKSTAVKGWDLRGDGGYVVGPGSHFVPTPEEQAKGKVEGWYRIEHDAPLAPAPDWLLALIVPRNVAPLAPPKTAEETTAYGRAALHGEIAAILATTPGDGECNQTINNSTLKIARYVAGGQIRADEAHDAIMEALAALGIADEEKALGTFTRAWAAGIDQPKAPDEREPVTPDQALGIRPAMVPPPPPANGIVAIAPPPPSPRFGPNMRPLYVGANDIHNYFAGCVYIAARDKMFCPTGVMVNKSAFDRLYGGPEFCVDYVGEKKIKSAWDMFALNATIDMPKVWDVIFRPELPPGAIVELEGLPMLNTFVPVHTPRAAGDASRFVAHVRKMLPHGRDADLLLHWMASCVQNPGAKFQWWPVVQGVKGNGKSLLNSVMFAAIGERYSHQVRADAVIKTGNQFNDWISGKLFLGFEEIRSSEGRRDFVEIMKDTVTAKRLGTEGKGAGQTTSDNRANGMMLTNWKDACPIDDDERRFAIFFTAQQTEADLHRDGMGGDYFPDLYDWLDRGGYAVVHNFLATYPLQAELDPARKMHRAPQTTSTAEAISASRGAIEQEVLEAIEQELPGFRGGVVSGIALRGLIDRMRRSLNNNKYRAMMASIGYVTHPALEPNRGRLNSPLSDGTRPVLYFAKGHEILSTMGPTAQINISEAVELALSGSRTPATSNVIPLRR